MRTRTTVVLITAAAVVGLAVSSASAANASPRHLFNRVIDAYTTHEPATPNDQNASTDEGTSTEISGVSAPIFRTPKDLSSGAVTVTADDVLIITNDDGTLWAGTGGAANTALATFTSSNHDEDASFNAAFTFTGTGTGTGTGTTTAWVTDQQGHRTNFTVTVTAE